MKKIEFSVPVILEASIYVEDDTDIDEEIYEEIERTIDSENFIKSNVDSSEIDWDSLEITYL